jgi:hypothetical protein
VLTLSLQLGTARCAIEKRSISGGFVWLQHVMSRPCAPSLSKLDRFSTLSSDDPRLYHGANIHVSPLSADDTTAIPAAPRNQLQRPAVRTSPQRSSLAASCGFFLASSCNGWTTRCYRLRQPQLAIRTHPYHASGRPLCRNYS